MESEATPTRRPLRATAESEARQLAGSLIARLAETGSSAIESIGTAATYRALKAVIIARGMVVPQGFDLAIVPSFFEGTFPDGQDMTGMTLLVVRR